VFRAPDQSVLVHNFVSVYDPGPHAWERFTQPRSPLGLVQFPDVMAMHRGEVLTSDAPGEVTGHSFTDREWLPWLFTGRNGRMEVRRTVGEDVLVEKVRFFRPQKAMLLLEFNRFQDHFYRFPREIGLEFRKAENRLVFTWGGFEVTAAFRGNTDLAVNLEPSPLVEWFRGVPGVTFVDESTLGSWNRNAAVWVGVPFDTEVEFLFAVRRAGAPGPAAFPAFAEVEASERRYWQDTFDRLVPPLKTEDPVLRDAYYFAMKTVWANQCRGGRGSTPFPYTSPSRAFSLYSSQWYWDEAYISQILRHFRDPELPFRFLKNFIPAQFADGGVPGSLPFAADFAEAFKDQIAGRAPSGMQPPVISIALELLRENPGWPRDVRPLYDFLRRNANWHMSPQRDTDGDGLAEYHHTMESSADMSPRWKGHLVDPSAETGAIRPVESADYNVWMAALWDVLADLSKRAGDGKSSASYRDRAKALRAKIEALMWDETDGFYYDLDGRTHERIRVKTHYGFMPLLMPGLRPDRARRLVREHLLNPREFACAFPVPSVSMDHPDFDPEYMWVGPSWVNVNWLIVEGLHRSGFEAEARSLARRTVEMVGPRYENGVRVRSPQVNEWFHPLTGAPLGNEHYSWSALVADLILRFLDR
jgi:hypothetical protein